MGNNFRILFALMALALLVSTGADSKPKKTAEVDSENIPKRLAMANSLGFLKSDPIDNLPTRKDWTLLDPDMKAKAAVAKDLDSDIEMFGLNTNERWALASLTKLMSAVVAAEELGVSSNIVMSEKAMSTEGVSGNFRLNEVYSSGDLIKAMLVVSSNRAAMALADSINVLRFVDKMQMKANSLGMVNTTFAEPTGLSFANQGTVEDLEKLVKYIYKNHPALLEISRQKSATLKDLISGAEREILNINAFSHSRTDFYGGKTGYTDQAGGNLITILDHEGRKILYVVLGTDDRFGQTELLSDWTFKTFSFK